MTEPTGIKTAMSDLKAGRITPDQFRAVPWTDTPQQKAILHQNKTARRIRRDYPQGTPIISTAGMRGTVYRHIPHTNAQGGVLVVDWENGVRGRVSPIAVRRDDHPGSATGPEPITT